MQASIHKALCSIHVTCKLCRYKGSVKCTDRSIRSLQPKLQYISNSFALGTYAYSVKITQEKPTLQKKNRQSILCKIVKYNLYTCAILVYTSTEFLYIQTIVYQILGSLSDPTKIQIALVHMIMNTRPKFSVPCLVLFILAQTERTTTFHLAVSLCL